MAMKYLKKINAKLQSLYRKNEFLNPNLHRFLCNSMCNYTCVSCYPLVSKKIKKYRLLKINVSVYA